ncbi:MAG: hypothetical protein DI598_11490 [Pseudopedobacter saltans]|uniref:Outer membrane protein beta-barrel domain-containing protein n=1 Tax=Pseudopedobacter saltans TaxID=151895 RepID=A0A2W5EZQ7_9SPHI|nr:MAG: hypothetical protein DI598_11490 [Pseudopedobacter saltans]
MDQRKPTYNPEEFPDIPSLENQGWEAMRQMLDVHLPQQEEDKRRVIPIYWRWMAAAVVLLLLGTLGYFYLNNSKSTDIGNGIVKNSEPSPNGNHIKDSNTALAVTSDDKGGKNGKDSSNKIPAGQTVNKDFDAIAAGTSSNEKKHGGNATRSNQNDLLASRNKIEIRDKNVFSNNENSNSITTSENSVASRKVDNGKIALTNSDKIATSISGKNSVAVLGNNSELNTSSRKMEMDVKGLNDNQTLAKNNITDKENVEGRSEFRKRLNQALVDDFKSDSTKQADIAKAKKNVSDSQLTARRKEQLAQFFEEKEKEEKASSKVKPKVDLAVLVNRNMTDKNTNQSGNSLYNMPIYPALNASVKLSDKVGFTTGVGTAAPGNFTNTSISGPVSMASPAYNSYVSSITQPTQSNDKAFLTSNSLTAKEVALTSQSSSTVQQAYYWQIPLMFDYYMAQSKLKLSGGTDFSIIQKVLVGNSYSSQLMDGSAYNNSGGVYQLRNFDPRLSVGAQYRVNQFLFGARFSRSFQPAIQYNGAATNGGNNQVFNFSIGYSFFK